MTECDLESLLLDFRNRGDVAALAAVFDRTSNELLTIALHLVPEASQAEDVVQATFLSAIQSIESFDSEGRGRRVMPWLVGILANHAARVRRERKQGVDPTRVDARPEPDPADEVERREVAQILARAIDDLPESCRDVVKRHLLDGERAVDIARSAGIAAGTVRMQILRGLERLRRALPAGMYAVAVPLRGSDAVRSRVLEAARAKAAAISAASSLAPAVTVVGSIGGTLVSLKILLGFAALAAVVLVTWKIAATPSSDVVPDLMASPVKHDTLAGSGETPNSLAVEPARAGRTSEAPGSVADQSTQRGWFLVGTVRGLDGKPAEETKITVRRIPGSAVAGTVDARAHFAIDLGALFPRDDPPRELLVSADHPRNRHGNAVISITGDQCRLGTSQLMQIENDVELQAFALVTGRLAIPNGFQLGDASVELVPEEAKGVWGPGSSLSARLDTETGRFSVKSTRAGAALIAAVCNGLLPTSETVSMVLGETTDAGVLRLEAGDIAIEGRISLPFEHAGLEMYVRGRRAGGSSEDRYESHERFEGHYQRCRVRDDDSFRLSGLSDGTWQLDLQCAGNCTVVAQPKIEVVAPSQGLVIGPGIGRITVEVHSEGASVHGQERVVLRCGAASDDLLTAGKDGRASFLVDVALDCDIEVFFSTVAKHVPLLAAGRALDCFQVIDGAPSGEPTTATLVLEPVGETGAPARMHVEVHSPRTKGRQEHNAVLKDGKYRLENLTSGQWTIDFTPSSPTWYGMSGGEFLCEETLDVHLVAGETLVRPIVFRPAGRARFEIEGWSSSNQMERARARLVDAQGATLRATFVVRTYQNDQLMLNAGEGSIPLHTSSELAEGLVPGTYQLVLDDEVWTADPVSFSASAGETTTVRLRVRKR